VLLGYRLDGVPWLTETAIGGGALLLLPHAINNPASTSATQRLATTEYLDHLRPAKPTMTTPASGKANGSHGMRLSARRRSCFLKPPAGPGPAVVMDRVMLAPALAGLPAGIDVGLKVQLLFVSVGSVGLKLQENVTPLGKVVPATGVTLNV